ncbi:hypothetical protein PR048_033343 [Dryococelus australis]|uniref:Uncharacterized protein n=1 Tax=Dryococelus australis TaxID=614101 RepID=A0ABQ9G007_9NEOP|nr:hypothetical protein PR048_033343 [Dryococelus australis]
MERRRNERAGGTGDPRENPPTSGIVRHDPHLRKSGVNRLGILPAWFPMNPSSGTRADEKQKTVVSPLLSARERASAVSVWRQGGRRRSLDRGGRGWSRRVGREEAHVTSQSSSVACDARVATHPDDFRHGDPRGRRLYRRGTANPLLSSPVPPPYRMVVWTRVPLECAACLCADETKCSGRRASKQ